jgi:hypothetical protein
MARIKGAKRVTRSSPRYFTVPRSQYPPWVRAQWEQEIATSAGWDIERRYARLYLLDC